MVNWLEKDLIPTIKDPDKPQGVGDKGPDQFEIIEYTQSLREKD